MGKVHSDFSEIWNFDAMDSGDDTVHRYGMYQAGRHHSKQNESSQEPESPPNSPDVIVSPLERKIDSPLQLLVGFLLLLKAWFHLSDKLLDLII